VGGALGDICTYLGFLLAHPYPDLLDPDGESAIVSGTQFDILCRWGGLL